MVSRTSLSLTGSTGNLDFLAQWNPRKPDRHRLPVPSDCLCSRTSVRSFLPWRPVLRGRSRLFLATMHIYTDTVDTTEMQLSYLGTDVSAGSGRAVRCAGTRPTRALRLRRRLRTLMLPGARAIRKTRTEIVEAIAGANSVDAQTKKKRTYIGTSHRVSESWIW